MWELTHMSAPALLAYIGPGLGAGAVALILGLFTSIALAVFTICWYPAKRVIRRFTKRTKSGEEPHDPS